MPGMSIGFFLPSVQASRRISLRQRCSKQHTFSFAFPFTNSFQRACRALRGTELRQFVPLMLP